MSIVFSKLVRQSDISLQDKTVSPSTSLQEVTPDQQYYGLSKVTVNPVSLQNKSVQITENGTTRVTVDGGYNGMESIDITTNVASGGNSDEYLNMIRGMMNLSYIEGSGSIYANPFSITPDIFPSNTDRTNLLLAYNPNIISVEIPKNINVANFVAQECNNLKYIESYSNSTRLIAQSCNNLKYINAPKIEFGNLYNPFHYSALNHIRIPQVYSIISGAFSECSQLKVIDFRGRTDSTIPSVSSRDDFNQVPSDCKVVIPDNLYDAWTNWGTENRSPWYSLSQSLVYVRESEYATDGLSYELLSGGSYPGYYCTGVGTATDLDITIAKDPFKSGYKTTMIKSYAFDGNTNLLHITMPSTLRRIEEFAFRDTTSLKSIDFSQLEQVPELLYFNAFAGVPNTCKIIIPSNLYDSWITSPVWSEVYNNGKNFVRAN